MVAYHHPAIVAVPLGDVVGQTRNVPPDSDIVQTARGFGISFGD
jgi:ATP-dependent phosphofructokinase / diphosphate-dependent phosphofructokinase